MHKLRVERNVPKGKIEVEDIITTLDWELGESLISCGSMDHAEC